MFHCCKKYFANETYTKRLIKCYIITLQSIIKLTNDSRSVLKNNNVYVLPFLLHLLKNRKLSISRLEASLTIKEGRIVKKEKKRKSKRGLSRKGIQIRGSISDRRFITTSRNDKYDDRFESGYNRCAN